MFFGGPSNAELLRNLVSIASQIQNLTKRVLYMSQEITDLRNLVTTVIGDVNAKLAELVATSTSLSAEDKAAISVMTDALTALDTQVKPAPVEPVPAPAEPAPAA